MHCNCCVYCLILANEVIFRLFGVLGSQQTLQRPIWTSSSHSRANTVRLATSRLRRFLLRCGHANWASELLDHVVPRTFGLKPCDRCDGHLRSPFEGDRHASIFVTIRIVHCAMSVCIQLGSLTIAASV